MKASQPRPSHPHAALLRAPRLPRHGPDSTASEVRPKQTDEPSVDDSVPTPRRTASAGRHPSDFVYFQQPLRARVQNETWREEPPSPVEDVERAELPPLTSTPPPLALPSPLPTIMFTTAERPRAEWQSSLMLIIAAVALIAASALAYASLHKRQCETSTRTSVA